MHNEPQSLYARQDLYIDRPPITASATKRMTADLYRKSISSGICPFKIVEILQKYSHHWRKWNIKYCIDWQTRSIGSNPGTVQNKVYDANSGDQDGPPNDTKQRWYIRHQLSKRAKYKAMTVITKKL